MIQLFISFLLAFLFLNTKSFSQTLIVPNAKASFEMYQQYCHQDSYLCVMEDNLRKVQSLPTDRFNSFLEQLDYSSESFKKNFLKEITSLLQNEVLSTEQVEIILQMISKIKEITQNRKQLEVIETELQNSYDLVQKNELKVLPQSYFILFKKPVSAETVRKLSLISLKIPIFKSEFNKTLSQTTTRFLSTAKGEFLLEGSCEKTIPHASLESIRWQAFEDSSCHFMDSFSSAGRSAGHFLNEHKTLLTTGLIVLGVGLLLNQYEVKLEF